MNPRPPLAAALLALAAVAAPAFSQTPAAESFLAAPANATLVMRAEAVVYGPDVTLRQLCVWPDPDAAAFAPVADLVIVRLPGRNARELSVEEVKKTLAGAGFNLARVNFAGPTRCAVRRSDAPPAAAPPMVKAGDSPPKNEETPAGSTPLRAMLIDDLAARLSLPPDALQVDFDPADAKLLALSAPLFGFDIEPRRATGLGRVSWAVTVRSGTGEASKSTVAATARAWRDDLVAARPLANRQVIAAADVTPRRHLVDRLGPAAATVEQVVGQQAARAVAAGEELAPRDVEAVRLAAVGQFITVTLTEGAVRVKTVAKALDEGHLGESIRVRNETTRAVFSVRLTGPQTADAGVENGAE